jgi:hypothetical protein
MREAPRLAPSGNTPRGFTECHPADATVWILPEFTQLQDALLDPLLIPAHG